VAKPGGCCEVHGGLAVTVMGMLGMRWRNRDLGIVVPRALAVSR
jgi:hypothetical protein